VPQTTFAFQPGDDPARDEPKEPAVRLVWLIASLLRDGRVELTRYGMRFGRGERSFKRDITKLRRTLQRHPELGFGLAPVGPGRYKIVDTAGRAARFREADRVARLLVYGVATAMGGPVARLLADFRAEGEPFLRVAIPRLVDGSRAALLYEHLESAASKGARVRFTYRTMRGETSSREVEPYLVTFNMGRYYLIGWDVARRAWRQYALDAIQSPISTAGSILRRRDVPAEYRSDDVIGLFKGATQQRVTVRISALIAPAISSRLWQRAQRVEPQRDGSALLTFQISDLGEISRWALGFGPEARIVAPPAAVAYARRLANDVVEQYEPRAAQARVS
jgi:predicted DNA-binding transcriptional regulator YafY